MNRVNLMPADLCHVMSARRWRRRCKLLLATTGAVALAWSCLAGVQLHRLNRHLDRLERAVVPVLERGREYDHLQLEHRRLSRELTANETLRGPIPAAYLLALVSQLMPQDTAATRLTVTYPPIIFHEKPGGGRRSSPSSPVLTVDLSLDGVAANHAAMPEMLERFARCDVFTNVRLVSNRQATLNDAVGQVFRVSMSVPLTEVPLDTLAGGAW